MNITIRELRIDHNVVTGGNNGGNYGSNKPKRRLNGRPAIILNALHNSRVPLTGEHLYGVCVREFFKQWNYGRFTYNSFLTQIYLMRMAGEVEQTSDGRFKVSKAITVTVK